MPKKITSINQSIGFAACLVELNGHAPNEIRLFPAGKFKAKDGRPHTVDNWYIDEAIAKKVIAASAQMQDQTLIDYEHQTLYAQANGQPAPAAAWFKTLEWRVDGLYATGVEWTAAAAEAIKSKEYRYISPVFPYDKKTGAVTAVIMAALVNYPAIDGLEDLAAAHFNFKKEEEEIVDKELIKLLDLDKEADQRSVNEAIVALKVQADKVADLQALADKSADMETEMAALKANTGNPDPAKFVPVATMTALQQEVAALRNQINSKESGDLIEIAMTDGRLLPAQQSWAESLDVVALKAYLKDAQPIAGLANSQTNGQGPIAAGADGLDGDEVAMCKALGLGHDDFKKTKGDK